MTQISEIHGIIPKGEYTDRGKYVGQSPAYIPYTALTKGEMKLALLQEQASIYASAFPDFPEYRKAVQMFDNALRSGVSNGVKFVGALHSPFLQQVASEINAATRQTSAASKGGLLGRASIRTGIQGIGNFQFSFDHDCVQYATKATNAKFSMDKKWNWYEHNLNDSAWRRYYREQKSLCKTKIEIEKIVNDKITNASHHVLYYGLNEAYPAIKGSTVVTKHLLHIAGLGGLANATDTDRNLMGTWSETSILRRNSTGNVGPIGSIQSSLNLSPDYDAYAASYAQWQKNRVYSSPNPKTDKIGEPLTIAAITALVTAIGSAVAQAAVFQKQLNDKKAGAMSAAQAYGTPALESKGSDWDDFTQQSGSSNNMLILAAAAAAAAALYLLKD